MARIRAPDDRTANRGDTIKCSLKPDGRWLWVSNKTGESGTVFDLWRRDNPGRTLGHARAALRDALFLKDLAKKTREGLRGRALAGKSAGGLTYGYRAVRRYTAEGEPIRGDREIHPEEAAVVERIMRAYAEGLSPKKIAEMLNLEGIAAPREKYWSASTIHGNRERGTGILNNELYIGRLVWNRQHFVKDPDTGKRQARPNPPEDWITEEVPHLRIISDD
ncbi:recombinase family protein, partial [Rhodobacter sp. TJ_12]|uniref:recombinase family protein n=1 Tax=Rhodobacter sp. TJ_12 TaxID=2029399 RepID=UPI001CC0AE4C